MEKIRENRPSRNRIEDPWNQHRISNNVRVTGCSVPSEKVKQQPVRQSLPDSKWRDGLEQVVTSAAKCCRLARRPSCWRSWKRFWIDSITSLRSCSYLPSGEEIVSESSGFITGQNVLSQKEQNFDPGTEWTKKKSREENQGSTEPNVFTKKYLQGYTRWTRSKTLSKSWESPIDQSNKQTSDRMAKQQEKQCDGNTTTQKTWTRLEVMRELIG